MEKTEFSDKVGIKKGPWTPEEDKILTSYIQEQGPGNWRSVPTKIGLMRCSESCRLRWTNHLRLHEIQQAREMNNPLEKAIREVRQGYELTNQLRSILELHSQPGNRGNEMGSLIQDLLQSLELSLASLRSSHDTVARYKDGGSMEFDSGECLKFSNSIDHNRRNRETNNKRHKEPRTKITSMPHIDGYQWRKYGHKAINNSQYSRSYYRCTHKDGQNCIATKQVQQRDSLDPPIFLVTYLNHHTCSSTNTAPQLMLKSPTRNAESFSLIHRSDSIATKRQDCHSPSSFALKHSGDTSSPKIGTLWPDHTASQVRPTIGPLPSEISEGANFPKLSSHGSMLLNYLMMDSPTLESPEFEFEDVESFLNS